MRLFCFCTCSVVWPLGTSLVVQQWRRVVVRLVAAVAKEAPAKLSRHLPHQNPPRCNHCVLPSHRRRQAQPLLQSHQQTCLAPQLTQRLTCPPPPFVHPEIQPTQAPRHRGQTCQPPHVHPVPYPLHIGCLISPSHACQLSTHAMHSCHYIG